MNDPRTRPMTVNDRRHSSPNVPPFVGAEADRPWCSARAGLHFSTGEGAHASPQPSPDLRPVSRQPGQPTQGTQPPAWAFPALLLMSVIAYGAIIAPLIAKVNLWLSMFCMIAVAIIVAVAAAHWYFGEELDQSHKQGNNQ